MKRSKNAAFVTRYADSIREFRHVKTVTACGLMAALALILGSVSIDIGNYIRIGFSGIPNQLVDFLFGPVVGCLFSGALDILKFVLHPTGPFFPGFTLNAMLAGLIYGTAFYKKPISLKRILAAEFIVALFLNVLLNTLWLSILYGQAFLVLLPPRILKNMIMWPINSLILYLVLRLLKSAGVIRILRNE